jgi:hypothetical protein
LNVEPFAGLEIEMVGGVLPTVTAMDAVAVDPSASVIDAVIVWVPFVSRLVKFVPVPIAPSRLEVHAIEPVRLPCSKSHDLGRSEKHSLGCGGGQMAGRRVSGTAQPRKTSAESPG